MTPAELLHRRLGHFGAKRLQRAAAVDGTELNMELLNQVFCESCIVAKQTRTSFKHSNQDAGKVSGTISADLMGPFTRSRYGDHYILNSIIPRWGQFPPPEDERVIR
jgi:hypothetical protein